MGVRVGTVVGPVPGGATVVTVSGGSCGRKVLGEGWGDVLVGAVGRGEVDIHRARGWCPDNGLGRRAISAVDNDCGRDRAKRHHTAEDRSYRAPSAVSRPGKLAFRTGPASPEAARALVVRVVLDFPDVPNALVEVVNCVTDGADVIEPLPADGVSGGVSGWPRPNRYGGQGRLLACW